MKISIITPACNAADTICDTIASVIDQTYYDIEYILVDRSSTDETLPIFLSMRHSMDINRTKHITVEDKDLFRAIEKGVEMATGDIIGILGAGDFYSSDDVISSVMNQFSGGKVQMVYGDMKFVNSDNTLKVTRQSCGRFYRRWPKTSGMTKCHPALFITKELFLKSGGFRKGFPLAADYEMMVRLLSNRGYTRKYLRKEMVSIRQDRVNSAEADAYRKELLRAFEVNDNPQSQDKKVTAKTTPQAETEKAVRTPETTQKAKPTLREGVKNTSEERPKKPSHRHWCKSSPKEKGASTNDSTSSKVEASNSVPTKGKNIQKKRTNTTREKNAATLAMQTNQ